MHPFSSAVFPSIPFDTAKAAWAVFGRDNFYITTGDQANRLFYDFFVTDPEGQPHKPSHMLAMFYLITIFQFIETLPDTQAADAVQERIEWKYALHLPLNYPGLAAAALCEFRRWLVVEPPAQSNLQLLLQRLCEVADCPTSLSPDLRPSQVISTVCQTTRLAKTWEALKLAMEALANKRPEWLLGASLPHWYERYSNPQRYLNLSADRLERHGMIHKIGADGFYLLKAISESGVPGLIDLPEVMNLFQIWGEQYEQIDGKVQWRSEACAGCSLYSILPKSKINSNHDAYK